MKQLFFSMTLALLFLGQSAVAQKNTFFTDVRYYPVANQPVYGATFGYFRQVAARRELGVKFAVTANDPNDKGTYFKPAFLLLAHIDITNRWKLTKKRKANWYAEAGLSGLYIYEIRPPYQLECINSGSLNQAGIDKMIKDASLYHHRSLFSPGLSTVVSWEYAISSKFLLGLSCLGNLYFLESDIFSNLLLLPSLRTAYRF